MNIPLGEKVLSEDEALSKFDSFGKAVIRNERRNIDRAWERRKIVEQQIFQRNKDTLPFDQYPSDKFTVRAGHFQCILSDEKLYEAMRALPENLCGVLIAQFWQGWNDYRIAEHYRVSDRAIRKWRKKAYEQITAFYESRYPDEIDRRNYPRSHEGKPAGD